MDSSSKRSLPLSLVAVATVLALLAAGCSSPPRVKATESGLHVQGKGSTSFTVGARESELGEGDYEVCISSAFYAQNRFNVWLEQAGERHPVVSTVGHGWYGVARVSITSPAEVEVETDAAVAWSLMFISRESTAVVGCPIATGSKSQQRATT